MRSMTKSVLAILVVAVVAVGAAEAGCGVKDTHEGTLKAYDQETNTILVTVGGEDGEEVKIALTKDTTVTDGKGEKAEPAALVGTKVKVVSEHAKADSVQQVA